MEIYQPAVPGGYEWVVLEREEDWDLFVTDGRLDPQLVKRVRAKILARDQQPDAEPFVHADLPWFSNRYLMLRDKAIETLGPVLVPFGQLIPLSCREASLVVFDATTAVDALDEARSDIVRFDSSEIMNIEKPVFRPDRITPPQVFKLPQDPRGSIYLTGDLVQSVEALKLSGTEFRKLWDSGGYD